MDEFHDAAELMVLGSRITAEASRQEEEQGSDAFAATAQDVGGDCIDQGHAGVEVLPDSILYSVQFITVGVPHIRHAVQGCDRWTLCHAADGMAAEEIKSSN
ncbi:MAG: hypothetical protein NTAFB01_18360 [Nitrospira sp.]